MGLYSIYFTDSVTGYVTGRNGTILKTTNAGTTWNSVASGGTDFLASIKFLDDNTGYISGGNIAGNTSTILKTNDAGSTWTTETTTSNRQFGVALPNFNAGYSCGLNGNILKTQGINVGINDLHESSYFSVAPNPFSSHTVITFSKRQKNTTVKIIDILGKVNKTIHFTGEQLIIEKENMEAGIYFIQTTSENNRTNNIKFIVQ